MTDAARYDRIAITPSEAVIMGLHAITKPYGQDELWMLANVERDFEPNPERKFRVVRVGQSFEAWAKRLNHDTD